MTNQEYRDASERLARVIVDAYGKDPAAYDDLEEQIISAFLFGAHRKYSMTQAGVAEWESKIEMLELMNKVLGFSMDMAGNAIELFNEVLEDQRKQPVLYGVMECGATGSALAASDPKELSRTLREIIAVLGQRMEITDETV